ncbi:MAG: DNA-binding NarL/FixJ family response regulator [Crocinitomix sp.]|jgi:DNA-binding NarL/FixJ family response regulator
MKTIKIGLIERNELFGKGLSLYLNENPQIEVISCEKSYENLTTINNIDVLIFDTRHDNDFSFIRKFQSEHSGLKTILLSSPKRLFENCLFSQTHKINAFLSKEIQPEELIKTILELNAEIQSEIVLPKNLRERIFGRMGEDSFFSMKERTVLGLLGKGKTTKEASVIMNLSFRTIETHRRRMIERLGCKNIIPVILYAIQENIIQVELNDSLFYPHTDY